MTQKTVLTELIEELKSGIIPGGNPFITTTINLIIDMAESKLPKERQDLIDAYVDGRDSSNPIGYIQEKFGI